MQIIDEFTNKVDSQLRMLFGKQLYYPKDHDKAKLLKLKVWSERYKVPLSFILEELVPYFEKLANKHSRKPKVGTSKGLGTTISILTGSAAEDFLKKKIEQHFPEGENIATWREDMKEHCLAVIAEDESDMLTRKPRTILQYNSITAWTKAYEQRIMRRRNETEQQDRELGKQSWRGNPFR